MAPRISLALAIHNHQPVGNFGWVFAEVYEQAYQPMVDALERHPTVRLSLHYTGPLLEWLRVERPEFIDRLAALVARDQVEILGGGYYEPVLASLPERDRIGQLRRMADELEGCSDGARPGRGWPSGSGSRTCRPRWSPAATTGRSSTTPTSARRRSPRRTSGARTRPTTRASSCGSSGPSRASATGSRSGTSGGHRLPARPRHRGRRTDRDDGRRRREVRRLADDLGALLGRASLGRPLLRGARGERRLADDDHAVGLAGATIGRSAGSTSRPARTTRWASGPCRPTRAGSSRPSSTTPEAAPPRGALAARRVLAQLPGQVPRDQRPPQADAADLGQGRRDAGGPGRTRALDHLYRGQSNDCYWHGLFGGIYIGHMRLATYEHLIAAEDLADRAAGRLHDVERRDLDLDGLDDVRLAGPGQVVTVDVTDGAGIGELGHPARPARAGAVMRRRPEAYHETLREHDAAAKAPAAPAETARRRSDLDPRHRPDQGGRPLRAAPLRPVRAPVRARPVPRARDGRRDVGGRPGGRTRRRRRWAFEVTALELDRLVASRDGDVASDGGPAAVRVTKELRLGGDRRARRCR